MLLKLPRLSFWKFWKKGHWYILECILHDKLLGVNSYSITEVKTGYTWYFGSSDLGGKLENQLLRQYTKGNLTGKINKYPSSLTNRPPWYHTLASKYKIYGPSKPQKR